MAAARAAAGLLRLRRGVGYRACGPGGGRGRCATIGAARACVDGRKVVVLTGPTAVGKTELSLVLAERLGGEIISADSVQVYRGLDVGSAKISLDERRGIPHHLIDLLPPEAEFSAGHFYELARHATEEILQRGRTPIIVGGTGFYLRWFVHGKPRTPESTPEMAARAEAALSQAWAEAALHKGGELTSEERWETGVALVAAAGDPATADKLRGATNNMYRLHRQLEVVLATGQPLAELDMDIDAPLQYDFRCFFLSRPRAELYRRADARCEDMLAGGLLQESKWLLERGVLPDQACAGRAIGYRQAMTYLQCWHANPSLVSKASLMALLDEIQAATRKYVHRQLHWFRADPLYRWLDACQPSAELAQQLLDEVARPSHRGAEGSEGKLTRAEEKAMREYVPQLTLLKKEEVQQQVLQWLHHNVVQTAAGCSSAQRPPEVDGVV